MDEPRLRPAGREVLAALLVLRGRGTAHLHATLAEALPVVPREDAAARIAAALTADRATISRSNDEFQAGGRSAPALRFLRRAARRRVPEAAWPILPPLGMHALGGVVHRDAASALDAAVSARASVLRCVANAVEEACASVEAARQAESRRLTAEAADLAVALAERLIGQALESVNGAMLAERFLGGAGVPTLPSDRPVRLRAHPMLIAALGGDDRFIPDPRLDPFDVFLEAPRGRIDLRLRTRLATLLAGAREIA